MFLITLNSITLDSNENVDIPPSIGDNDQVEVIILPNDNPEGVLTFRQSR